MAFDFGTKRIGIAVTDPLQLIATGLCSIETKAIIPFITRYLAQESVELFLVGDPRQCDNSPSDSAVGVLQFRLLLAKHFTPIPIASIDERFTSKMASQAIAKSGMGKLKRQNKALIDQTSAVLILQAYMAIIQQNH